MRVTLTKQNSTKSERRLAEVFKELKVPFEHRVMIDGREIDFVVKNIAIEIDGHSQDVEKNTRLLELGYAPIHLQNKDIKGDLTNIKVWLQTLLTRTETS